MTRQELSTHVAAYFDLMDGPDPARVIDVFTADAVVTDDGHTYRGHEDILGWLTGPASEFTTTSTWLSAVQHEDGADVVIILEGDFPGGRVELNYRFTKEPDGLITSLDIAA